MAPKRTFPPFITASSWATAYDAAWNAVKNARGFEYADDGTIVPMITNGDAVTLVRAWSDAATRSRFPLWYQFAAVAYGWSPQRDQLDATNKQRDRLFPVELSKELWIAMMRLAGDLDDEAAASPKLITDWQWSDPVWLASLRTELQQDGARATFKIPTGLCTDAKTGRKRVPRPPCDKNGQGPINPLDPTGPRLPCDKPGDCPPDLMDDPITGIRKSLTKDFVTFAMVAIVAWVVWKERQRRGGY